METPQVNKSLNLPISQRHQQQSLLGKSVNSESVRQGEFQPGQSLLSTLSNVGEARRLRLDRENDVRKLHTRISLLQAEEEKALRRIEETRAKAQQMLEFKIEQEEQANKLRM